MEIEEMGQFICFFRSGACALLFILSTVCSFSAAPSADDGYGPPIKGVDAFQVRPDGKIVAVSDSKQLVLLNADGSIETTYTAKANNTISAITLQPDGKILLGGYFSSIGGITNQHLARLNSDGTVDGTFHSVMESVYGDLVDQFALQADGKILICGEFKKVGGIDRPKLARLNNDGSLDTTFNDSMTTGSIGNYNVIVQPDGKIIFSESYANVYHCALKRLNPDGSADASFHPDFVTNQFLQIGKVILQPDGKILVGGIYGAATEGIVRLKSDGTQDTSFQVKSEWCQLQALQADGKIVARGRWLVEDSYQYGIIRFNPDGSADPGYRYTTPENFSMNAVGIQPDGKLVLSGRSVKYTPKYELVDEGIFRLNVDGSRDSNFDFALRADAKILALARQSDGKIVIGGDFIGINGFTRNRVARLNADGSLDSSFDPKKGPNGTVSWIGVQPGGKLVIFGSFTSVSGSARNHLARLNPGGSLDMAFNPKVSGDIDEIRMMTDGRIVLAGDLGAIDGGTTKTVARLNVNGSLDTSFDSALGTEHVESMDILPDGRVMLAGVFYTTGFGGHTILRLKADGKIDTTFSRITIQRELAHLKVLRNGKILYAEDYDVDEEGEFFTFKRRSADGAVDDTFSTFTLKYSTINAIEEQDDGKLLMCGDLRCVNPATSGLILRVKTDGRLDTGFDASVGDDVYAMSPKVGKIMIAGDFMGVGGEPRSYIAQLNEDGSVDKLTDFMCSSPDGEVDALATDYNDGLIIGGKFQVVYGTTRDGSARVGASGNFDSTFTAVTGHSSVTAALTSGKVMMCHGSGPYYLSRHKTDGTTDSTFAKVKVDARINGMAVQPSYGILIAGGFHHVKSFVRNQIARVNEDGSLDVRFNAGDGVDLGEIVVPDDDSDQDHDWIYHQSRGTIRSIAVQTDGKIIIGGEFDRVSGVARKNIARLMADGPIDATFNPGAGADGQVFAVAFQPDGKILIAGDFISVGGLPRNGIARLNSDGSVDPSFVPETAEYNYFHTLAVQADGKIFVGGFYSCDKGYGRIARLNADGSLDTLVEIAEPPNFDFSGVYALALQCDGKLVVGGRFDHIGSAERRNIARMSNPDAALESLEVAPGGAAVTWRLGGSYPQPYQVLFEDSSDGVTWNQLGWGTPVAGVGFRLNHLTLPILTTHYVRATGWTTSGFNNGSVSLHRSALLFFAPSYNAAGDWAIYN